MSESAKQPVITQRELETAVRDARQKALEDCREMALKEALAAQKTKEMDLNPVANIGAGAWYGAARGMAIAIQNMINETNIAGHGDTTRRRRAHGLLAVPPGTRCDTDPAQISDTRSVK